jgi:hypothetical protein
MSIGGWWNCWSLLFNFLGGIFQQTLILKCKDLINVILFISIPVMCISGFFLIMKL